MQGYTQQLALNFFKYCLEVCIHSSVFLSYRLIITLSKKNILASIHILPK